MPDALPAQGLQRRALVRATVGALGCVVVPALLHAQEAAEEMVAIAVADRDGLELLRYGDEVLLSATLNWTLPALVKDALLSGIPVHFVTEVEMLQARWYWSDKELLKDQRYMRLSYQPLTRRWRLHIGTQPIERQGLGMALSNTFDTLDAAVQTMQRIARWRIGRVSELPNSGDALLKLRFRIDISHFPRPLQIGALGRPDWNLLVTRQEPVDLSQLQ